MGMLSPYCSKRWFPMAHVSPFGLKNPVSPSCLFPLLGQKIEFPHEANAFYGETPQAGKWGKIECATRPIMGLQQTANKPLTNSKLNQHQTAHKQITMLAGSTGCKAISLRPTSPIAPSTNDVLDNISPPWCVLKVTGGSFKSSIKGVCY